MVGGTTRHGGFGGGGERRGEGGCEVGGWGVAGGAPISSGGAVAYEVGHHRGGGHSCVGLWVCVYVGCLGCGGMGVCGVGGWEWGGDV